jgi:hypothetical protein
MEPTCHADRGISPASVLAWFCSRQLADQWRFSGRCCRAPRGCRAVPAGSARELENALFEGDLDGLDKLSWALRGDLNKVTESAARRASGGLELADSAFRTLLPVPIGPKSTAALIDAIEPGWFRTRWLRLFQPQIWFVFGLGRQGRRVTNILPVMFERFGLPRGGAERPLAFLEALTTPMVTM